MMPATRGLRTLTELPRFFPVVVLVLISAGLPENAGATLTVSAAATQNMDCSGGVCSPTAASANLNVTDLENALGTGNLTVTTTGSGGVQATDIEVDANLSWNSTNALSLDAFQSIHVDAPIAVSGGGGFAITTNDGGSGGYLNFASGANVSFSSLSSSISVNGLAYTLVDSVTALANAVGANPSGNYAFANNYDAVGDGTYNNSPIPNQFSGSFEGLGNSISNLSLSGTGDANSNVGLFAELALNNQPGGAISDLVLQDFKVTGKGYLIGGLVGLNAGTVSGVYASGTIGSGFDQSAPGLLVGANYGTIIRSGASGKIKLEKAGGGAGCLAEGNEGTITQSYASCSILSGLSSRAGGLIAENGGTIGESYATGAVTVGKRADIGGLVGIDYGTGNISQSYSTTALNKRHGGYMGGFIGSDAGTNASDYWDISTSGVSSPERGAGNIKNDPGITGLTSKQLRAKLPPGFDPNIWAEDSVINKGFPYLIANPPHQQ